MANVATAKTPIRVQLKNGAPSSMLVPVLVTFDTLGEDLTVFTPVAGRYGAVLGMKYSEASAHGLIWKSGTDVYLTEENPVSTRVNERIGRPIFVGAAGEVIRLQCTTAVISSMLLYCAEFNIIQMLDL